MNYPRHNYPVHIHTIDVFTQARMFQKEKHFEAEMPKQWYNKCRHIEIGLAFTSLSSHTSYGFFLIKFIHQFFFTKLWNVFFHNWHNTVNFSFCVFAFICPATICRKYLCSYQNTSENVSIYENIKEYFKRDVFDAKVFFFSVYI